jgi:hypothetical protein
LVGWIISVSKSPVYLAEATRCQVQVEGWIRNDRHVETGVRVLSVAINDTQGNSLFVPHLSVPSPLSVHSPLTNLGAKSQTERLGYGRRIADSWAFEVETAMANVDGTSLLSQWFAE